MFDKSIVVCHAHFPPRATFLSAAVTLNLIHEIEQYWCIGLQCFYSNQRRYLHLQVTKGGKVGA